VFCSVRPSGNLPSVLSRCSEVKNRMDLSNVDLEPLSEAERLAKFGTGGTASMMAQALTRLLAERVMKWTAGPNLFMLGGRTWIPNWRFQPCENLADAFQLLDTAKACRANL